MYLSGSDIDLQVPNLARLHERRSEKWSVHDPDVLGSTVAEMDFPLAPAVIAALHAAVDRHDLGYTAPRSTQLPAAFADFARRRLGWGVDQDQVTLVPDVMAGLIELCRALLAPGDQVAFFTPAYPPFFAELPQARVELVLLPLGAAGAVDLEVLQAALAGGVRALVLANPQIQPATSCPGTSLIRSPTSAPATVVGYSLMRFTRRWSSRAPRIHPGWRSRMRRASTALLSRQRRRRSMWRA